MFIIYCYERAMKKYLALSILLLSACASTASSQAANNKMGNNAPIPRLKPEPATKAFTRWKQDFIARARAKGYSDELLARTIGKAKINPKAIHKDRNQPEFVKPVWSYIDSAMRDERVNTGKAKITANKQLLADIERKYGVNSNIVVAIWGLESAYGEIQGDDNMIDSLATLAFDGRRRKFAEAQLYAILDMLVRGDVRQSQLKGSWAGAMGQTQFIPTTFLSYAVDYDGNGNKDLWNNLGDALGSTANYLSRHGWQEGEPVVVEITLPEDKNNSALFDGTERTVSNWTRLGIAPVNGKNWANKDLFLKAKLIAPAGIRGPVFLTFKNFDVIKKYNNSTSYALGVHGLAQSFAGKRAFVRDWPRADKALNLSERKSLQAALNAQGYNVGVVDGIIGRNTKKAIRRWQRNHGLIADGYVNHVVLKKIIAAN